MLKDGFTAEEVDKAKRGWLQQQLQSRSSDGFLVNPVLLTGADGGTMTYNAELEQWIAALTPDAVNAAMRKYIVPSKLTTVEGGALQEQSAEGAERGAVKWRRSREGRRYASPPHARQ